MKTVLARKIGTGIMALLLAVSFLPAVAGARARNGGQWQNCAMKGGQQFALGIWQNQNMIANLGLTTRQVKKIRRADHKAQGRRLALRTRMNKVNLKLDRLLSADFVNKKAVRTLTKTKVEINQKMLAQKNNERLIVSKILTPRQNKRLQRAGIGRKGQDDQFCQQQGMSRGRRNNS